MFRIVAQIKISILVLFIIITNKFLIMSRFFFKKKRTQDFRAQ